MDAYKKVFLHIQGFNITSWREHNRNIGLKWVKNIEKIRKEELKVQKVLPETSPQILVAYRFYVNLWKNNFDECCYSRILEFVVETLDQRLYIKFNLLYLLRCALQKSWFNPLFPGVLFLYFLKTWENRRFSDVFREYKQWTPSSNGLNSVIKILTALKASVFGVFLLRIFLHLDKIRRYTLKTFVFRPHKLRTRSLF